MNALRRVLLVCLVLISGPACGRGGGKGGGSPGDTTPPAAVTDLSVTGSTVSSISLSWTAPGDNGNTGTASSYEIRYSTSAITAGNWTSATPAVGVPVPLMAGTTQTLSVTGLSVNSSYYFALKTTDAAGNVSGLSNIATGRTAPNVVYTADASVVGVHDLFVTDTSGTSVTNITNGSGDVLILAQSPDGSRLAFVFTSKTVLYVASTSGGPLTPVSGSLVAGGGIGGIGWAPDGSRLFYIADQDTMGVRELYTVRPDGTGLVKVSGAMIPGATGLNGGGCTWSPDSSRIAYQALQGSTTVAEIYVSRADGSGNVKISGSPLPGTFLGFGHWAPNGSRFTFTGRLNAGEGVEIYTVFPDGTGLTRACPALATNQSVNFITGRIWSTDSTQLAYIADQNIAGTKELFVVHPDGTGLIKISGAMVPGGQVRQFGWSPLTFSRIAYTADQDTLGTVELYTSTNIGGGNAKISTPLVAGGNVDTMFWASDESRIAYLADANTDGTRELFTAVPTSSAGTTRISGTLLGGEVTGFNWCSDNTRVAYRAQQNTAGIYELYTSLAAGGGNVRISPPITSGPGVWTAFFESSLSPTVVFQANASSGSPLELFSAASDGSSTTKISSPIAAGGKVQAVIVK